MTRVLQSIFWWGVTLVTLILLDDLVFGPFFWALAAYDRTLSTALAFVASWAFGLYLVRAGLSENPGRVARFFLQRLMLGHKSQQIKEREARVGEIAASGAGALLVTPIIGGVIPALVLRKYELMSLRAIRAYAVGLTALYAMEFAAVHGWGAANLISLVR